MKKILQIYNDYYPPVFGGIEKHINTICEGLQTKFDITALVANRSPLTEIVNIDGVEVIKAGTLTRLQSAPISLPMPFWLKNTKADILHFHLPCPTAIISYFLARPKGKVIVTYHSDIVRQKWAVGFYKPLVEKFLNMADFIIATSPNYIESSAILNKFRHKCIVIPLGIDLSKFKYLEPEEPTVLFVGKLRYYKGLEYLIAAMKDIDAKLLVIGTGTEEKKLKTLSSQLNINHKIAFLGNVSEERLPCYYSNCSVFVLPAVERSEAFGTVQLEAMASGKPVVSTNLKTGVPWVNQDSVTGLIVPPKDIKALANAINKLLQNPSLRGELGKNARLKAEKEFSQEKMLKSIIELYNLTLHVEHEVSS